MGNRMTNNKSIQDRTLQNTALNHSEPDAALPLHIDTLTQLAAKNRRVYAHLQRYSILVCDGPDAESFLQGQLTGDVATLDTAGVGLSTAQLSSCCNPQGRMISLFHIAKIHAECFWLILPAPNLENTYTHLHKYSVFSQVSLKKNPDNLQIYGLINPAVNSPIQHRNPDIKVIPLADREQRLFFMIHNPADQPSFNGDEVSESVWQLALLLNGLPHFDDTLSGVYMPSDLHIDQLGGVSFKKGCYTGQEPIARLHYKGVPKFSCHLMSWHASSAPDQTNTPVFAGEKKVGHLVQALALDQNQWIGLFRLRNDAIILDNVPQATAEGDEIPELVFQLQLQSQAAEARRVKVDYTQSMTLEQTSIIEL